jgi:uncharacterized membrane protein
VKRGLHIRFLLTLALALWILGGVARAQAPVVRAVLFYSPSCGHCHKVITEDLPPLFEKYGDRLQMIGIDVSDPEGSALYGAAAEMYRVPEEARGVPLLVVAGTWLTGSVDIPEQFPLLIEKHLAAGGVDWPAVPGLAQVIARAEAAQAGAAPAEAAPAAPTATVVAEASAPPPGTPTLPGDAAAARPALAAPTLVPTALPTARRTAPTPTPGLLNAAGPAPSAGERFARDPVGNGLAVIVLAGMVGVVAWVAIRRPWRPTDAGTTTGAAWRDEPAAGLTAPPARGLADWAVPLLALIGLGVAGYLAYVETQQVAAVCGPVGDCNAVQQSEFARLFGLFPIGVLGVIGYLGILMAWAIGRFAPGPLARWAQLALFAMAGAGVLFSIYLTFLEPFVIGATCAWCLSSAVIMTLLLLLAAAGLVRQGRTR